MSVPEKKKERPFLEAFLENAEAATDLVTDNEIVKAIPVVGTALKLWKGVSDMRDRAFAAKLKKFVEAPHLQSLKDRGLLLKGLAAQKDAVKIGEALFLVLEGMRDLEKPEMLARAFAAYLEKDITSDDLLRLAFGIDRAFTGDLRKLADTDQEAMSRELLNV